MGMMASLVLGALAVLGAVCVKVFADEFKAWVPTLVAGIVAAAVRTLPAELRERFSEEWLSHIKQVPGDLGKITVASGFLIAAFNMANGPLSLRKRVLDIALASIGLIFLGPALIFMSLLIKLDSAGPILFRQTRIGRDGKPFQILKFRTMYIEGHAEVTKIGRFLRASSFDELPQLINVLTGDMSLVGPRPLPNDKDHGERSDLVEVFRACRPGLSGLWLLGRQKGLASYYAANWSLKLDVKLLLATMAVVMRKRDNKSDRDLKAHWKIGLLGACFMFALTITLIWSG